MTTGTRLETDAALAAAFEYPAGGPALALVGPAGTGKSFALVRRALAIAPRLQSGTVLVSAPDDAGTAHLRAVLGDDRANVQTHALSDLALETLRAGRSVGGHAIALDAIDDVTAAALFEDASASLFSLEWPELAAAEIDPEITGLRSPQRFAAAAFRLIKKLRAAIDANYKNRFLRIPICCGTRPRNIAIRCASRPPNSSGNVPAKSISCSF